MFFYSIDNPFYINLYILKFIEKFLKFIEQFLNKFEQFINKLRNFSISEKNHHFLYKKR